MPDPAVFLDRDGTLMEERNYCADPADVAVFPGVPAALQRLAAAGFRLVLITNQSGIGRGFFTEAQFEAVQAELARQLLPAKLDAVYFCPSTPEANDPRRKPSPSMVLEAVRDLNLDPARSWFVGDKAIDAECGRRAGTGTILVRTGHGHGESGAHADSVAATFPEAADLVLGAPRQPE
jgi:D-glycero-D-manno-heptose 1,7-bisphosphate phosphatase